ncbi:MAG: transposase [Acidimicrobiaceae bacterium]|nr:transposase [Ilumatobacter sp.]MCB9380794.1 transposase [Acidimicrobiaceae bacterium]MCO5331464.1 transposase [Ilumatobacteraceae bacterium]
MIGIDPHKRTHTAVAVELSADIIASRQVHAKRGQTRELLSWADSICERRTWAIESAGGLGYLLAQQLVAAGEEVIDIPAVLSARVRVLSSGTSNKNDPNDAYAVALAALYGKDTVRVRAERVEVAREMIDDLAQLAAQRKASERRIRDAVAASGTTLTEIFGIGDVLAATLIGHTGDISRFANDDKFAAYNGTAPVERSSGDGDRIWRLSRRGNRAMNHAIHIAAVTQIRHAHSPGRAFYDRKRAEGKSPRRALRALKRRISDTVYRTLVADAARTTKH